MIECASYLDLSVGTPGSPEHCFHFGEVAWELLEKQASQALKINGFKNEPGDFNVFHVRPYLAYALLYQECLNRIREQQPEKVNQDDFDRLSFTCKGWDFYRYLEKSYSTDFINIPAVYTGNFADRCELFFDDQKISNVRGGIQQHAAVSRSI